MQADPALRRTQGSERGGNITSVREQLGGGWRVYDRGKSREKKIQSHDWKAAKGSGGGRQVMWGRVM